MVEPALDVQDGAHLLLVLDVVVVGQQVVHSHYRVVVDSQHLQHILACNHHGVVVLVIDPAHAYELLSGLVAQRLGLPAGALVGAVVGVVVVLRARVVTRNWVRSVGGDGRCVVGAGAGVAVDVERQPGKATGVPGAALAPLTSLEPVIKGHFFV